MVVSRVVVVSSSVVVVSSSVVVVSSWVVVVSSCVVAVVCCSVVGVVVCATVVWGRVVSVVPVPQGAARPEDCRGDFLPR